MPSAPLAMPRSKADQRVLGTQGASAAMREHERRLVCEKGTGIAIADWRLWITRQIERADERDRTVVIIDTR